MEGNQWKINNYTYVLAAVICINDSIVLDATHNSKIIVEAAEIHPCKGLLLLI